MCGILGYFGKHEIDSLFFNSALEKIAHRGPDFRKYDKIDKINYFGYLGHTRLAIIGLDDESNQPFSFDGLKMVFNGEIYNYKAIKSDLIKVGYDFKTNSDTEVLLKAFHAWGTSCLKRLNGMFAFAVLNELENTITLCRDRFGVKPLYYTIRDGEFIFSSELKSIFQLSSEKLCAQYDQLKSFLIRGWMKGNDTGLDNCFQVSPGSFITIDLETWTKEECKFWDLQKEVVNATSEMGNVEELIEDSIRLRMVSDVQVGCFLSGGIDSSLVASVASRLSSNKLKTFNIKFIDTKFDESENAEFVSRLIGTEHHAYTFHPKDALAKVEKLVETTDHLFNDWSTLPMLMLSEQVSQEVKVVLSGDGGDEFFFGYEKYFQLMRLRKSNLARNHCFNFLAKTFMKFNSSNLQKLYYGFDYRGSQLPYNSPEMLLDRHAQFHGNYMNRDLFNPDSFEFDEDVKFDSRDISKSLQLEDVKSYLLNNILPKVDRSTMAYGLEAREPLLDYRLLQYTMSIPQAKLGLKAPGKIPLIKMLKTELPGYLVTNKRGFSVPMRDWMRRELKDFVRDNLSTKKFRETQQVLQLSAFDRYVEKFFQSNIGNPRFIWGTVLYSCWLQRWSI